MSRFSVIIQAKVGNVFLPRRPKPMLDPEVMLNKPKVFKQYIFRAPEFQPDKLSTDRVYKAHIF